MSKMLLIGAHAAPMPYKRRNAKDWPHWKELVERLRKRDVTTVQLCCPEEPEIGADKRLPNMPLDELRKVIYMAHGWVSVDTFLQHVAWEQGRIGVVIWGPSDPTHFGHPENINIVSGAPSFRPNVFDVWHNTPHVPEIFPTCDQVENALVDYLDLEPTRPEVSIIIPTYNHGLDCLKPCVEAIWKYTTPGRYEIIVSANGCKDETRELVDSWTPKEREFSGVSYPVKLVWSDEPLGYPKAINAGVKAARGRYLIFMNDDCFITESPVDTWLNMLLAPIQFRGVAVSGPLECNLLQTNDKFMIFLLVAMHRDVFRRFGPLDETFTPGGGEDCDFCFKVQKAGMTLGLANTNLKYSNESQCNVGMFPCWHRGESTVHGLRDWDRTFARNTNILIKRHLKHDALRRAIAAKCSDDAIKFNLGCGPKLEPGYLNVDVTDKRADFLADCTNLDWPMHIADEIMAIHLLEHIQVEKVMDVLKGWHRILKPGGKLVMEMPDILELCRNFEAADEKQRYLLINCIYGATLPQYPHRWGWYPKILADHLAGAGFKDITFMPQHFGHWGHNLRVEAIKPGAEKARQTWDCFMFWNEYDLLEIRLNELKDVVDHHLIVEGRESLTGQPKETMLNLDDLRFAPFKHKIIHVPVDYPMKDVWGRERWQRDIIPGLLEQFKARLNDAVILTDADEIPNAESVRHYDPEKGIQRLGMQTFYYFLNGNLHDEWTLSRIMPLHVMKKLGGTNARYIEVPHVLRPDGWHFSYQGGVAAIQKKLENWSHQEYNRPEIKDSIHISQAMLTGDDVLNRKGDARVKVEYVPLDDTFPAFVRANLERFQHLIHP